MHRPAQPATSAPAEARQTLPPASGGFAPPQLCRLGRADYLATLAAMREYTETRGPDTPDQIWSCEHPPVFTTGLATRAGHVHAVGEIPVVATERGGQVTYHGPGQVVAYLLLDLHRRKLAVRELVHRMEAAAIATAADWGVATLRRPGAPGLYLAGPDGAPGAKIASLGLKVRRGCTFHGMAFNARMDLSPFERIDPCGFPGLAVTDLAAASGRDVEPADVAERLLHHLCEVLDRRPQ